MNPVSPKVQWSTAIALIVGIAYAAVAAITPEMLAPLGKWSPIIQAVITAALAAFAGYKVTDPLRTTASRVNSTPVPDVPLGTDLATPTPATPPALPVDYVPLENPNTQQP